MALTTTQLEELLRLINLHVNALAVDMVGPTAVTRPELEMLRLTGMIDPTAVIPMVDSSFHLGRLGMLLGTGAYSTLTFQQLVLEAARYPLFEVEEVALEEARGSALTRLHALGDQIAGGVMENVDPTTAVTVVEQQLRTRVVQAVERRWTPRDLAQEMGKDTGGWARDWDMVAHTTLWDAHTRGRVSAIENAASVYKDDDRGEEATAFIRPRPGACPECKAAYLDGRDNPVVRPLREWKAFGTNVGVPKRRRKPVIPPHHPWCDCALSYAPPGWGFDAKGTFTLVDPQARYGAILAGTA